MASMDLDLLPLDSVLPPVEFVWYRGSGKKTFQWIERISIRGTPPTLVLAHRRGRELRAYKPLEEDGGLFLTFAATDPTPEGALGFAEHYGPLGESVSGKVTLTDDEYLPIWYPADNPETAVHQTETEVRGRMEVFIEWRDAIIWMRHLHPTVASRAGQRQARPVEFRAVGG